MTYEPLLKASLEQVQAATCERCRHYFVDPEEVEEREFTDGARRRWCWGCVDMHAVKCVECERLIPEGQPIETCGHCDDGDCCEECSDAHERECRRVLAEQQAELAGLEAMWRRDRGRCE